MGSRKFRQGHSVCLGLPQNVERHIERTEHISAVVENVQRKMNWLMATVHAITKPFTKVIQNYRRKV